MTGRPGREERTFRQRPFVDFSTPGCPSSLTLPRRRRQEQAPLQPLLLQSPLTLVRRKQRLPERRVSTGERLKVLCERFREAFEFVKAGDEDVGWTCLIKGERVGRSCQCQES